jgi:hypothetical protein
MRGNHDCFNAPRGSAADGFAQHSATAAALGRAGAVGGGSRLRLMPLPPQLLLPAAHQMNDGAPANASDCPAALLLGLDLTPPQGLHAPANFFGAAPPAMLAAADAVLTGAVRDALVACGGDSSSSSSSSSPVVAYSHYPLSTVAPATARSSSSSRHGGAGPGPNSSGGHALRALLARSDVAAHLSGHLHDLPGHHMHLVSEWLGAGGYGGPRFAELEVRQREMDGQTDRQTD